MWVRPSSGGMRVCDCNMQAYHAPKRYIVKSLRPNEKVVRHFCDSDQLSVHRFYLFPKECFQRRSQGFQRATMLRLFPPILTRTGKHTLLRHYLRVSTFHRSIVIDLHAENPSQDFQRQDAKSKIFEMAACVSEIGYNASP